MSYTEAGTTPTESCYWHYRTNNVSTEHYELLQRIAEHDAIDWIIIGEIEEGEIEKGVHFHCAIKMKRSSRKSAVQKLLMLTKDNTTSYYLGAKYSASKPIDFIKYVIKNGKRLDSRLGEVVAKIEKVPKKEQEAEEKEIKNISSKELYKERIRRAKDNDWEWFNEHDPKWTLSAEFSKLYAKYFRAGSDLSVKPIEGKLTHYWIYGNSGTGKSSSIEYLYPDRYKKIMTNEKWDGYDPRFEGHKIVHIDELNSFKSLEKGMEGLDGLKCKVDRNPFAVRKNYGVDIVNIRPQSFIITSNYTPSQLLSKVDERGFNVDIEAKCLYRKFRVLHVSEWLRMNRLVCLPEMGIFDMTVPESKKEFEYLRDEAIRSMDRPKEPEFLR